MATMTLLLHLWQGNAETVTNIMLVSGESFADALSSPVLKLVPQLTTATLTCHSQPDGGTLVSGS